MRDELIEDARALEAIGVLTRSTTHDLNNQMTAIMTFADLVLDALPDTHPIRVKVEEIRMAGERAIHQTRELDRLARKLAPIGRRAS
jgi:signal transduction histidine kinase